MKTKVLFLIFSFLLPMLFAEPPFLYKGKMGPFAILQEREAKRRKLIGKGEKYLGYKILKIRKSKIVCISPDGEKITIRKNKSAESVPKTPEKKITENNFIERQKIRDKLRNTTIQLFFYSSPFKRSLNELEKLSQIPIIIAPEAYMYNNAKQITLSTDSISLKKALDLIAVYMDLDYYIEDQRIVFTLKGKAKKDPYEKYLLGMQKAVEKITQNKGMQNVEQKSLKKKLQESVDINLDSVMVEKVPTILSKIIGVPVTIDFRIRSKIKEISFFASEVSAQKAFDQLSQKYSCAWTIVGNGVYFSTPNHIASLKKTEERQTQSLSKVIERQTEILKKELKLKPGVYTIQQIKSLIREKLSVELIIHRELWETEYSYRVKKKKKLTLKQWLEEITKGLNANYVFVKDVIYLIQNQN